MSWYLADEAKKLLDYYRGKKKEIEVLDLDDPYDFVEPYDYEINPQNYKKTKEKPITAGDSYLKRNKQKK